MDKPKEQIKMKYKSSWGGDDTYVRNFIYKFCWVKGHLKKEGLWLAENGLKRKQKNHFQRDNIIIHWAAYI